MTRTSGRLAGRRAMPGCSAPSPACSTSRGGLLDGSRPAAALEAIRTPVHGDRACGWERRSPGWHGGDACSPDTIGHTGFTGTGLWIDFARGLAWTLLTNRVHPTRHGADAIFALRPAVGRR